MTAFFFEGGFVLLKSFFIGAILKLSEATEVFVWKK